MRHLIVLRSAGSLPLGAELPALILRTPDAEHPYLETAEIRLPPHFASEPGCAETFLDAVACGVGRCIGAGTWGDYDMPGTDMGGAHHFIREWCIEIDSAWFKSGNDHGLPRDKYFPERLIHNDKWLQYDALRLLGNRAASGELDRSDVRAVGRDMRALLRHAAGKKIQTRRLYL